MYADRAMLRRGPQSVSLGASFLISSAIVAALIYVSPDVIPKKPSPTLIGRPIPLEDPPPPEPAPRIEPKTVPESRIVAPIPVIPPLPTTADPVFTTGILPAAEPAIVGPVEGSGETRIEPMVPALVAATLDPRHARDLQPDYPGSELRSAREGGVTVRVLIGIDGRVKAVERVSATSDAFFEATRRQALSRWRFTPAMRGGIPEESWKRMSVRFELRR